MRCSCVEAVDVVDAVAAPKSDVVGGFAKAENVGAVPADAPNNDGAKATQ